MKLPSCPCCRLPTLSERSSYEICVICWWEDDGQDDPRADEVWGGPNGKYSLAAARRNFAAHGHMYDAGRGIAVVERPSRERLVLISYAHEIHAGAITLDESELGRLMAADRAARED